MPPETPLTSPSSAPRRRALAALAIVTAVSVASVIIYRAQMVSSRHAPSAASPAPVNMPAKPSESGAAVTGGAVPDTPKTSTPSSDVEPLPRVHFSGSKAWAPSGLSAQGLPSAREGAITGRLSPDTFVVKDTAPLKFIPIPNAASGPDAAPQAGPSTEAASPRVFFSGSKSALPPPRRATPTVAPASNKRP